MGGHDTVRIMDRQEEVLIWCRKCSGDARQRMGPKLLQAGANGHKRVQKKLRRIQILEEGRMPANEARNWKIEGQEKKITRKD